jgi:hypothetical protein
MFALCDDDDGLKENLYLVDAYHTLQEYCDRAWTRSVAEVKELAGDIAKLKVFREESETRAHRRADEAAEQGENTRKGERVDPDRALEEASRARLANERLHPASRGPDRLRHRARRAYRFVRSAALRLRLRLFHCLCILLLDVAEVARAELAEKVWGGLYAIKAEVQKYAAGRVPADECKVPSPPPGRK